MSDKPLLPQHDRYDFVPLTERKDYSWPDGKRLAFTVTTNIEWFAVGRHYRKLTMSKPIQDAALGDIASALQQLELPPERVARTRPLVEGNNAIVAAAARERLAMDDNPGDFIAWLQSFDSAKP